MRTRLTRRCSTVTLALILSPALLGLSGCAGGEPVTPEALAKARARWEKAGMPNYDLEWTSSGPRNNHYAVAVRDGQVKTIEAVAPDGGRHPLKPPKVKYYGVDGLFLTIADELAQLGQPDPFNQPRGTKVVLRFDPDPEYGYPRHYRRDVMGSSSALAIDVVGFTPVEAGKARHD